MNMFHVYSFHYITPKLLKEGADKFCIKEYIAHYVGNSETTRVITFPYEPLFFVIFEMNGNSTVFYQNTGFYIKGMPKIFYDLRNYQEVSYDIKGNAITIKESALNYRGYNYYVFAICA